MERTAEDLLCEAAAAGDCAKITTLLATGADASHFDAAGTTPLMHAACHGHADAVRCLLSAGSPWNALSPSGISAGDLAMDHGHQDAFDVLLNAGIQSELILGTIARSETKSTAADGGPNYLEARVAFSEERLMDSESKAVMMAWEKPLMEAHARAICGSGGGGRVLNVGFGMGLVDEAIQRYKPEEHTIVEAHPEVYERMIRLGWGEKENVKIVFGRWQDVIPQLGSYDGIFFDTYGEYYEDLRLFHEHLRRLLKPGGVNTSFGPLLQAHDLHKIFSGTLVAPLETLKRQYHLQKRKLNRGNMKLKLKLSDPSFDIESFSIPRKFEFIHINKPPNMTGEDGIITSNKSIRAYFKSKAFENSSCIDPTSLAAVDSDLKGYIFNMLPKFNDKASENPFFFFYFWRNL